MSNSTNTQCLTKTQLSKKKPTGVGKSRTEKEPESCKLNGELTIESAATKTLTRAKLEIQKKKQLGRRSINVFRKGWCLKQMSFYALTAMRLRKSITMTTMSNGGQSSVCASSAMKEGIM